MINENSLEAKYLLKNKTERKIFSKFIDFTSSNKIDIKSNVKEFFEKDKENFLNQLYKDFPELEKNNITIHDSNEKYSNCAVYKNEFKIYSKKQIVKTFKTYEYHDLKDFFHKKQINNENFIYKDFFIENNISIPIIKKYNDDDIIKMWKNCIEHELFPDILDENDDYILIKFLDDNFINLNEAGKQIFNIIKKNKDKLISYHNKIKNQFLCINDFNLKNFVVNKTTNEIFMIDLGDIDLTLFFYPELFMSDEEDKLNIWINRSIDNKSHQFYENMLRIYFDDYDEFINKIIFV